MMRRGIRSPMFALLQQCMREARSSGSAPLTRRSFLKGAASAGVLMGAAPLLQSCSPLLGKRFSSAPRIAIVGAGLAGLTAAHYLKKAGLHADIYEASSRVGGRCYTATGLLGPGLTTELGGEFIDTTHADILSLVSEFGLELYDYRALPEAAFNEAFYFDGELRSHANVVSEFRSLAPLLERDIVALENEGAAGQAALASLDARSISAYLDSIGASGWIRKLLEVAYVTEYGLDAGEQSSLNLLYLISPDTGNGAFEVFGSSDERFKVRGGNDLITRHLAANLQDQIQPEHRLERLAAAGESFTLDFMVGASRRSTTADFVILAVPFTLLRAVQIELELPPAKLRAIAELGYGSNSKLFLGFSHRAWRKSNLSGGFFSDLGSQSGWDNSRSQPGSRGGLTVYSGGTAATGADRMPIPSAARAAMRDIEKLMPDSVAAFSGESHRFHWPSSPWALGSYAAYRIGQWTSIAGHEGSPVGRLLFAGEHCSTEFQGFLNGAVQTGRQAGETIISHLSASSRNLPPLVQAHTERITEG